MHRMLYLHVWSRQWQLQIAIDKCQFLQLGYFNNNIAYHLYNTSLSPLSTIKDLGITINNDLKPSQHVCNITKAANVRFNLLMKCFHSGDYKLLIKAFKTYVRPILEYGTTVWSPTNIGDINTIENIQKSFTRKVAFLCKLPLLSYTDKLELFNSKRLELIRIYFDLIELFKIVNCWSTSCFKEVLYLFQISL